MRERTRTAVSMVLVGKVRLESLRESHVSAEIRAAAADSCRRDIGTSAV
jgi:hypothetical protein